MKRHLLFLIAIFALSFSVFGQNEMPKQISGGVLNGKATSLPKPAYPPAARAVNAEGAVSVQVLIDEQGNVASANAVSGHPLLRAAATEAAQGAKFSPTLLMGNPVKVSGVITYNFVGTLTPGMFGYEIAYADRTGKFAEFTIAKSLAFRLPETLVSERQTLESLTYEERVNTPEPPAASEAKVQDPNKFTVKGAVSMPAYTPQKLTRESLEKLRMLQLTTESRLATDPVAQWNFKLGTALGVFVAEIEDDQRMQNNAAELERLIGSTPAQVPDHVIGKLQGLVERAKSGTNTPEFRAELIKAAHDLRNVRIARW